MSRLAAFGQAISPVELVSDSADLGVGSEGSTSLAQQVALVLPAGLIIAESGRCLLLLIERLDWDDVTEPLRLEERC